MAEDFPESKYGYRLKPEMRSFGEVIVHIASGNAYAAKAGRGEKVKWDELKPKDYMTKAECVALMKKWIADANEALQANPLGWEIARSISLSLPAFIRTLRSAGRLLSCQRTGASRIAAQKMSGGR